MIKLFLAVWLGKIISTLSKLIKRGGGSAAPGYYALRIEPNLITKLSKQIPKAVVITGTNGKTTTSRMVDLMAREQGLKVIRNRTGSNMERGIASSLIEKVNPLTLKLKKTDLAVWEIDEATFKLVAPKIKPQIIVFLNAARDQLDRYGELDSLIKEWREALGKVSFKLLILVNNDDASTLSLTNLAGFEFKTFGSEKEIVQWEKEAKNKKKPDIEALKILQSSQKGLSFNLRAEKTLYKISFPIEGGYHVYDILASMGVIFYLGLDLNLAVEVLKSYTPAFGRVEKLNYKGKEIKITLIKNPNGATQVIKGLVSEITKDDKVVIALNDNIADGKDVSWIWDANFEEFRNSSRADYSPEKKSRESRDYNITCSGTRAYDLALRLKYAGVKIEDTNIQPSLERAFKEALKNLRGELYILPTYTALLELQGLLAKMGMKQEYWKEI